MSTEIWQLPDGIDETAGEQALAVENLRRRSLDRMGAWGFELIMPPMVEFTDALLTGVGADLDLQTLRVTDQLSGRQMAIRPDMTPQVARFDARQTSQPRRLCYCGSVLRARPEKAGDSRAPIQIGAEIFGVAPLSADLEVIGLLLDLLTHMGIDDLTLDVGHVGLFQSLVKDVPGSLRSAVEQALAQKDLTQLKQLGLPEAQFKSLAALIRHQGPVACLDALGQAGMDADAIAQCRELANHLKGRVAVHFDFAEHRGASYHTGLVFSLYSQRASTPVARGGRYDAVGVAFGQPRPATGFSADLRTWQALADTPKPATHVVQAPLVDDPELTAKITALRDQGVCVVLGHAGGLQATHTLDKIDNQWTMVAL